MARRLPKSETRRLPKSGALCSVVEDIAFIRGNKGDTVNVSGQLARYKMFGTYENANDPQNRKASFLLTERDGAKERPRVFSQYNTYSGAASAAVGLPGNDYFSFTTAYNFKTKSGFRFDLLRAPFEIQRPCYGILGNVAGSLFESADSSGNFLDGNFKSSIKGFSKLGKGCPSFFTNEFTADIDGVLGVNKHGVAVDGQRISLTDEFKADNVSVGIRHLNADLPAEHFEMTSTRLGIQRMVMNLQGMSRLGAQLYAKLDTEHGSFKFDKVEATANPSRTYSLGGIFLLNYDFAFGHIGRNLSFDSIPTYTGPYNDFYNVQTPGFTGMLGFQLRMGATDQQSTGSIQFGVQYNQGGAGYSTIEMGAPH